MKNLGIFREWQLVLPLSIFFVSFVFGPLALLGFVSSFNDVDFSSHGVTQYARFFGDSFNISILFGTLWIALRTTVLALLIGYPFAYVYTRSSRRVQRILILIIMLPLLTSAVVRTFAWLVILGRQGILNQVLLGLGLTDRPLTMLYTPMAVVVALVQIELPLMVLPLITALTKINVNLPEASEVLGARKWQTFFWVIVPLSMPGLIAGCMLVFAAAASSFVVQTLIGGGQNIFMPLYIYQQGIQVGNYPFAAAIAMILLLSVLIVVMLVNIVSRRSRGFTHA